MKLPRLSINMILPVVCLLLVACKTPAEKEKAAEAKLKAKQATSLTIHLETNADGTKRTTTVPVYRARPEMIAIEVDPFLDPGFFKKAELVTVDEHGGFAIKITLDQAGTFRLANVTTANKGRRLVIGVRWEDFRWLAAPRISRPITEGVLIFTPDATREEAERLVTGLNNVIKKVTGPFVF